MIQNLKTRKLPQVKQPQLLQKKNELHVAISANPPSLDPQSINSNIVGGIGIHVYESLFAMNEKYEPMPVLAESYEVSDDGMVYTIKLRRGSKISQW